MPRSHAERSFLDSCRADWFDDLPVPVFFIDKDAKIAYANPAIKELIGYDPKKMVGTRSDVYVTDFGSQALLKAQLQVFRGIVLDRFMTDVVRHDGSLLRVTASIGPIFDPSHKRVIGAMGIVLHAEPIKDGKKSKK